jgi:hypothetical protein
VDADQAFNEMKQFKFGAAMLHPEFKKFVYDYRVPARRPAARRPGPPDRSRRAGFRPPP